MIWWILDEAPIVGGAELFALRLGVHLQAHGDEVAYLTPAGSAYSARVSEAGLRVIDHPLPRVHPRSGLHMVRAVGRTRKTLGDAYRSRAIVLANTAGAQAYASVAAMTLRRRPPIVHVLHEQMTAARPSARAAFRRVGALVATGANTAAAYESALPDLEVGRLNNFLPTEAFLVEPPTRASGQPPVIGVLARMIPEKGILEFVDELAAAEHAWSEVRIAAPPQDRSYAARVSDRIVELDLKGRIVLLDWAEPAEFLDAVDVVVVPSTGLEGQPTVIIEALARGRAVVLRSAMWSSDFEGLPVRAYRDGADLASALVDSSAFGADDLAAAARRFGPEQAVDALVAAARRAD